MGTIIHTTPTMLIGFAGMTHLGWVMAAAAAEKGFRVQAMEDDAARFASADLVFLTKDVTVGEDGRGDFEEILAYHRRVLSLLPPPTPAVILSQVPPGYTRALNRPNTYYQVETLIYGKSFGRAMEPERFVVGCDDGTIPPIYSAFLEKWDCPVHLMNYESAELCKLAINAYLVASIECAVRLNTIAVNVGADWDSVRVGMQSDARIGPHAYLRPGRWDDSPHLKRDMKTLETL